MKILDRYILREYLRTFLGILAVLTIIMLLKEVIRELDDILVENPPFLQVFLYFVYAMPGEVLFVVPITVMLAMMFSIGSLAKHKEILAIHACGISYLRIAFPLTMTIVAITVATYVCNETMVPYCREKAYYIREVVFEGKDKSVLSRNKNVTTKGVGNRFYTMKNFFAADNVMERPTIVEMKEDGTTILFRIDAESAQLVEQDADGKWNPVAKSVKDKHYFWEFKNGNSYEFDDGGNLKHTHFESKRISMEENLDRFLGTSKKISQMGLFELYERSQIEGRRGKAEYYHRLKTELHSRLALPLAALLLGLLGYTFAVRSSIRSLVMEFGMALMSIVLYYGLTAFWEDMGQRAWMSPVLAAWATNLLFTAATIWRFRQLEEVPR